MTEKSAKTTNYEQISDESTKNYAKDVLIGKIVSCKWVKLACKRFVNDFNNPLIYYDESAAEHICSFFEKYLKHSKGEWAGTPVTLEPWERFIICNIFGWKSISNGYRRFRTAYIETGRKNGKTTLLAGIGNYLFFADGEPGAEIYTCATKLEQAKISHDEAKRMIKASPTLIKRAKIFRDNFSIQETSSKFQPLGADADTLDGLNIHAALIDELHAHKNRNLWDVVETATGSRRQPLQIAITTAGFDRDTICFMIHDYVEKILERVVDDDTFFGIIYGIDQEDKIKWQDESIWIKANPNLGVSVKLEDLQRKAKRAKEMPSQLNAFLQKHLDVWTEAAEIWIPLEKWDECFKEFDDKDLYDRECFAGLDLSSRNDITALSIVFPPTINEPMKAIFRFFIPQDNMQERVRRDRVPYDAWHRQGHIYATRGNVIDYDFVLNQIMEDCKHFKVMSLYYDIYGATRFSQDLRNLGFEDPKENKHAERHLVEVSSTYNNYTYPMKELEKLIYGKQIEIQKTPVMRWMASNMVLRMGPTGGIMPDKAKSRDKIDGVVSLCLGMMRALITEPQPDVSIMLV